jgi:hypothetical protein
MTQADLLVAIWALAFTALLCYWQVAEAAQPGQQYADPVLPCAYIATLAIGPVLLALTLTGLLVRWCRR